MNKLILISIKTKYAKQIFEGTKLYEYRKKSIGINNCHKKIYVYSSEIEKAIIGYIIIDKIIEGTIDYILENTNNENNKEIIKYYDGCEKGYALKIGKTIKFDKPIFLKEIKNNDKNFIVPQFYRYIKENEYIYKVLNKK